MKVMLVENLEQEAHIFKYLKYGMEKAQLRYRAILGSKTFMYAKRFAA